MTISIIIIPSVIHQGNDIRVPNVTFILFEGSNAHAVIFKRIDYTQTVFSSACECGAICYLAKNNNNGKDKGDAISFFFFSSDFPLLAGSQQGCKRSNNRGTLYLRRLWP